MTSEPNASSVTEQEPAQRPFRARRLFRTVVSVLVGWMTVSIFGVIMHGLGMSARVLTAGAPEAVEAPPLGAFRTITWILGLLIGGYVVGAIAGRREWMHALGLGASLCVLDVALLASGTNRLAPGMLPVLSTAAPVLVVSAGGLLRAWERTRGYGGSPRSYGATGTFMLLSSVAFLSLTTADYSNPSLLAVGISVPTFVGACLAFAGRLRTVSLSILFLGVGLVILILILASLRVAEARISPTFGGIALILNMVASWTLLRRASA